MALITGTPKGQIIDQDEIYLEGAPNIWYQDDRANLLNNPDVDTYYWGLSGTVTYPVYSLGCVEGVSLADNLTMNDIVCDAVGVKGVVERRNFLDLSVTLKTLFPLSTLRGILKLGSVFTGTDVEKVGIGTVDNSVYYRAYLAKVYDESVGDYLNMTFHRARFVDAWTLNFRYGQEWTLTNIHLRAFARDTLPSAQQFATIVRADPSAI